MNQPNVKLSTSWWNIVALAKFALGFALACQFHPVCAILPNVNTVSGRVQVFVISNVHLKPDLHNCEKSKLAKIPIKQMTL